MVRDRPKIFFIACHLTPADCIQTILRFSSSPIQKYQPNVSFMRSIAPGEGGIQRSMISSFILSTTVRMITELGFPSVDGCTNQPNVFYDPSSAESLFPRASKGRIDFQAQREALNATLDYLEERNQLTGNSDLVPRRFLWTWDARPFSFWPDLEGVWQDSLLWATGHWLQGKLGASSLGAVVGNILQEPGLTASDYDVARLPWAVLNQH